jgi:P-type conjugative transfer protein TrbL
MTDLGLLDQALQQFQQAISTAWNGNLVAIMTRILEALIYLQFFIAFWRGAAHRDFSGLFDDLTIAAVRFAVLEFAMAHGADFGNAVYNTAQQIAAGITGGSPRTLTPSGVIDEGLNIADILYTAKGVGGWTHPIQTLEWFTVTITTVVSWTIAALILFETTLEFYLLIYGGPILIGFSAFDLTAELIVSWIKALLAMAVKLIIVLGMLAIGFVLATIWARDVASVSGSLTTNIWNLLQALVMSVLFVYVLYRAPTIYANLVGRTPGVDFFTQATSSTMARGAQVAGQAAESGIKQAGKELVSEAAKDIEAAAQTARQAAQQVAAWLLAT